MLIKERNMLKEIVAKKKERILLAKQSLPEEELKQRIQCLPAPRSFSQAINPALARKGGINQPRQIALIAEIKKASPSSGIIRENFDLKQIAGIYKEAGVQAVSVLTEEDYFLGNISYINEVKQLVDVPVLRKDFILEPYQVYESRYYAADAILLIADLLSKDKLKELLETADSLGLDCLIEVHTEKELKKALSLKAPIIGINNRDLKTLEVDLKTTERLFTLIPKDKIIVVQSGIKTHQDILFLKVLGVQGVLIGSAFMQAEDIRRKIEEIMGW